MRLYRLIILIIFWSASAPAAEMVDWTRIGRDVQIVGKLGVPLGQVVQIDAVMVAGSSLGPKSLEGCYVLRVESVGGKKLPKPQLALFTAWGAEANLPNDTFSLFEEKEGRKPSRLTQEQIAAIEHGYVGAKFSLLVFEEGYFDGYPPKDLPPGFSYVQKIAEPGLAPTDPWPLFRPRLKVLRVINPGMPRDSSPPAKSRTVPEPRPQ